MYFLDGSRLDEHDVVAIKLVLAIDRLSDCAANLVHLVRRQLGPWPHLAHHRQCLWNILRTHSRMCMNTGLFSHGHLFLRKIGCGSADGHGKCSLTAWPHRRVAVADAALNVLPPAMLPTTCARARAFAHAPCTQRITTYIRQHNARNAPSQHTNARNACGMRGTCGAWLRPRTMMRSLMRAVMNNSSRTCSGRWSSHLL